ncbi:MAG: hypothetical protein IKE31_05940 [Eubacterium sp.]|nr:hypothetical protein [Eubacterium sp.]
MENCRTNKLNREDLEKVNGGVSAEDLRELINSRKKLEELKGQLIRPVCPVCQHKNTVISESKGYCFDCKAYFNLCV